MFNDRHDAGQRLGRRLEHLRDEHPVILGLPRGGVVVAAEVAQALNAPLDVLIVRKVGAPHQPELALGAVTDGQQPHFIPNRDLIDGLGIGAEYLDAAIQVELQEIRRRQNCYRRGRPAMPIAGGTVIVVDDGIATGATVRAGLAALKASNVAKIVLAVPVAPPETMQALSQGVDEAVCLHSPFNFMAVGRFYSNFDQTTDEEVILLLDEAAVRLASGDSRENGNRDGAGIPRSAVPPAWE
jgi:putative phosphoribosyl transferase